MGLLRHISKTSKYNLSYISIKKTTISQNLQIGVKVMSPLILISLFFKNYCVILRIQKKILNEVNFVS